MSVDNPSSHSSTLSVTSKYFSSNSGMDESLSDFQEKKKIAAPKVTQQKPKNKKALKRPRGQKDIRSVLRSKESELVAYTKDFDIVCKRAGIDVDSEQLQLAIALSKSVEPSTSETQSSQTSSQNRTAKIRSTLQEYGFTVPEIKIASTNRRFKKLRQNYKLLLQSETERQQNIADKYSQVLLQNIQHTCSPKEKVECSNTDTKLFYLSTNVPYEAIRDNNLYYLENLPLEKSSHLGSLLRDWSEIPGRPVSPKLSKEASMDVSEILCSQEEMNILLSGALKTAKNLIKNKLKLCTENKDKEIINISDKCDKYHLVSTSSHSPIGEQEEKSENKSSPNKLITETIRSYSPDMFDDEPSSFQDEEPKIDMHEANINIQYREINKESIRLTSDIEIKHPVVSSQCNLSQNVTKRKSHDDMELTECVGVNPSYSVTITKDTTKRKSDDFMELTECVIQDKVYMENQIDLTQNSDEDVVEERSKQVMKINDLTQSSGSNDTLPLVHVSGKNNDSLDDTVVLEQCEIDDINRSPGKEGILIEEKPGDENNKVICDLTKTTPKKSTSIEESSNDSFFEDFMYNHSHSPEQNDTIEKSISYMNDNDCNIDLTQSPQKDDTVRQCVFQIGTKHITEVELNEMPEFKNNCEIDLTGSPKENDDTIEKSSLDCKSNIDIDLTQSSENNNSLKSELSDEDHAGMDLTQNSSELKDVSIVNYVEDKFELFNKSSLGKQGDVSIDYDELCTSNACTNINQTTSIVDSKEVENNFSSLNKSTNSTGKNSENINSTTTSQESEGFEISDKELNYSMHKSRYEDCFEVNFGGISVVDRNRSNRNSNIENEQIAYDHDNNQYTSDSFLPEVDVKNRGSINESHNLRLSPIKTDRINNFTETPNNIKLATKGNAMHDIVKTPGNREYVMKTDQVTPIGDYMSMSTPERNKELEKYGLKPLKRKRAIQLLTHIYNQTHPLVEPCTSEVESPTKRRKTELSQPLISPSNSPKKNTASMIASKSPKKNIGTKLVSVNEKSPSKKQNSRNKLTLPIKNVELNYEIRENVYEVTSERVEIRNIECGVDEWVFQKREKAKLHSCRVPLHIAFHNYVSCRRGLREAILRYEPVEIDVIHKDLAASGHRYDPKGESRGPRDTRRTPKHSKSPEALKLLRGPSCRVVLETRPEDGLLYRLKHMSVVSTKQNDLLKFLDKKCITVKTVDNNARNNKK